ncbi:MAG: hypothetical protein NT091_01195 [Candidatus Falkowbacteria bacterium]|nr:hypothetical protein [Candidatus Falkowbacteria bacterium]
MKAKIERPAQLIFIRHAESVVEYTLLTKEKKMTQQKNEIIGIDNQENCGEKNNCAQLLECLCSFADPDSEACKLEAGYRSRDCLARQSIRVKEEAGTKK